MTQYLLSVHYVEGEGASQTAVDHDPADMERIFADVEAVNQQMRAAGAWVFAGGLEEPHNATVVTEVDGEIVTTDGPFPEAKEQLGGVWIIDVADQETGRAGPRVPAAGRSRCGRSSRKLEERTEWRVARRSAGST